jgi:hypothetical protein
MMMMMIIIIKVWIADMDSLYVKRKKGVTDVLQTDLLRTDLLRTDVLQIDATYKAEIINIAEYLNTKYAKDKVVNNFKSHDAIKQIRIKKLKQQQRLKND